MSAPVITWVCIVLLGLVTWFFWSLCGYASATPDDKRPTGAMTFYFVLGLVPLILLIILVRSVS